MKKLFVYPNPTKEGMKSAVEKTVPLLINMGFSIIMEEGGECIPDNCECIELTDFDSALNECECMLVIGGDGTILRVAISAAKAKKPILGVNKGTLGFIPELEMNEIPLAKLLLTDDFEYDNRMLLDICVKSENGNTVFQGSALNEVSVSKGTLSKMIDISVLVNGKNTMSFSGDGLIVCSPTGSTAYSLSAGGPILEPSCECMAVTPICPHAINIKSFVLPAHHIIEIIAKPGPNDAFMFADGSMPIKLSKGDTIIINRSELSVPLIRIKGLGFYEIIRKKLSKERA